MVDEQSEERMLLEVHGFYPGAAIQQSAGHENNLVFTAGFNFPDQSPEGLGKPPKMIKLRYSVNDQMGIERVPGSGSLINLGNRLYRESMDYAHLGCRHFVPCSKEELPYDTRVMAMRDSRRKPSRGCSSRDDHTWDCSTTHEVKDHGVTSQPLVVAQENCCSSDMAVSQLTSESGTQSEEQMEKAKQEAITDSTRGLARVDEDEVAASGGETSFLDLLAQVAVQVSSPDSCDGDLIKAGRFLHGEIQFVQKRVRRCGKPNKQLLRAPAKMKSLDQIPRADPSRDGLGSKRPRRVQAECNQVNQSPVTVKRVSRKPDSCKVEAPQKEAVNLREKVPRDGVNLQKKRKLSEVVKQVHEDSQVPVSCVEEQSEECLLAVENVAGAVVRSTRGRSQNLPARLQGSVLGAWKKGDRKKRG